MTSTTETPTPTPTPSTPHLSSLASALHSADRDSLARVFAEMADEALTLCDQAPSEHLWEFWLRLSEDFHGAGVALREPPKPKRRWFR